MANVLGTSHPNDEALSILDKRRPRFREFNRADRELENEFDVTDQDRPLSAPFRRVLDLADTDVDHLRQIWPDEGERDTHLGDCNRTLNAFFKKAWTQSNLSIHLKAEHDLLVFDRNGVSSTWNDTVVIRAVRSLGNDETAGQQCGAVVPWRTMVREDSAAPVVVAAWWE